MTTLHLRPISALMPVRAITAGGIVYVRRLSDVGSIEFHARSGDGWIADYIAAGCYAELRAFGRVEGVWRLMEVERSADGSLRIYGEDMMHIARDLVLRAPAGTDDAMWTGDAGAGMVAIAQRIQTQATLAYYGGVNMVATTYVPPTVNVSVRYAWATALEAMREIAAVAAQSGYLIWFGVGGASIYPDIRWALTIATPLYGVARSICLRATSETFSAADEGTVAVTLGRGVGEGRATHIGWTMLARSHRLRWLEARIDARSGGEVVSEALAALRERARDTDIADITPLRYPATVDLGDLFRARHGASAWIEGRIVAGIRVDLGNAAQATIETREVFG